MEINLKLLIRKKILRPNTANNKELVYLVIYSMDNFPTIKKF